MPMKAASVSSPTPTITDCHTTETHSSEVAAVAHLLHLIEPPVCFKQDITTLQTKKTYNEKVNGRVSSIVWLVLNTCILQHQLCRPCAVRRKIMLSARPLLNWEPHTNTNPVSSQQFPQHRIVCLDVTTTLLSSYQNHLNFQQIDQHFVHGQADLQALCHIYNFGFRQAHCKLSFRHWYRRNSHPPVDDTSNLY